jgi:hypothetical protein
MTKTDLIVKINIEINYYTILKMTHCFGGEGRSCIVAELTPPPPREEREISSC